MQRHPAERERRNVCQHATHASLTEQAEQRPDARAWLPTHSLGHGPRAEQMGERPRVPLVALHVIVYRDANRIQEAEVQWPKLRSAPTGCVWQRGQQGGAVQQLRGRGRGEVQGWVASEITAGVASPAEITARVPRP